METRLNSGASPPEWLTHSARFAREVLSTDTIHIKSLDGSRQSPDQNARRHVILAPLSLAGVGKAVAAFVVKAGDKTALEVRSQKLQLLIDEGTEPWGIKVSMVEVRDVELPDSMQRAMAAQAEAERERRAKIVHAEGEFQAAQKLADAAKVIASQPSALQLRYLQTLTTISTERTNTIVFPLPIDLITPMLGKLGESKK